MSALIFGVALFTVAAAIRLITGRQDLRRAADIAAIVIVMATVAGSLWLFISR